ncbi:bifunctional lysylphosphatidylglycerol flippase/synthetase MprF [Microbacterium testaceum]|uniref:bifunctional lysylphosphatidylglycerol flippase/synthetase MprF n=1 Tax=Microbacterium testaceum TaxID=2033 RepID=UPI00381D4DEE
MGRHVVRPLRSRNRGLPATLRGRPGAGRSAGPPVLPRSDRPLVHRRRRGRGSRAVLFSAGDATADAVPGDWRRIVVADDTVVDLPGLQFTGKAWGAVRTSLNRGEREGMTFRLSRLSDETWGVRQQLRAISEIWVGDKGLPEMGFTLGTLQEASDPEVRIALAVSPQGDVDGFLSWLPIYGEGGIRGWTLDLMRRRDGGFGPVMEFLIGASAREFSAEGAQIMSLSGAPLAHEYPADAGAIADLQERMAAMLEPVYGFASLHRFKQKFHPRYETMYLLYRDEADLTRIGAALTRAFLPHATLGQFAAAGVDLVRHER